MSIRLFNCSILICLFFQCSCKSQFPNKGIVLSVANEYDSAWHFIKRSVVLPEFKIWYKGNFAIQEIKRTENWIDSAGNPMSKSEAHHYTFVDLSTGSYYDYSSFSDTAKILKSYTRFDKKEILGFNFYDYFGTKFTRPIKPLGDTTINHTIYSRYEIFMASPQPGNTSEEAIFAYARCDRKGTIFDFARSMGTELDCPVTRMDYVPTKENPNPLSFEIEFISDQLSPQELKVFDAWEKNAKENPVKK